MAIALDEDLRDLTDSVARLLSRTATVATTRERLDAFPTGAKPAAWDALVEAGLLALHLPESAGGADAGLTALAVVAEQSGRALLPGPWLPTVLTGGALAAIAPDHAALAELAGGATGALVGASATGTLTARPVEDGWSLTGTSGPVLGLPGADHVLVRAEVTGDDPAWFVLSGADLAGAVRVLDPVDLTRSLGQLELDWLHVLDPVGRGSAPLAELVEATGFAAEAAGVSAWAVETAVAHVSTRVQFGVPIGSFQAVQHKAAMMLVRSEIAVAAAWDAARAADQNPTQQRLAAAAAPLNATIPAVEVALELVTLLGGIGFTWEHDAHLYWRRALSLAGLSGTAESAARRLGDLALTERRDFSFLKPDARPDLRAEVGEVLDEVARLTGPGSSETWQRVRPGPVADLLADARLVAPHYPPPFGRGAGPEEQAVVADEFARRGLIPPSTIIGEWVLPTLLVHGTEQQQARFIEPTLRGEIVWCQLFSEPEAGSDLASLRTRATKVEGGWLLNGQKVWTSGAHESQWGVCLARTDPDAPKHKGISYFLVDLSSPGVEIHPLKQATGRSEFNEVFLDDLFVPDDCLVGERDRGWTLAVTTLGNERLSMGARLTHGGSDRLRALLQSGQAVATPEEITRALGRCAAREAALSAMNLRSVLARLSGLEVGAEISVAKVFNSLAQREGSHDIVGVLGPLAATDQGGHATDHLGLPAVLFGGGTVEVQLNVIAQRVLKLPR